MHEQCFEQTKIYTIDSERQNMIEIKEELILICQWSGVIYKLQKTKNQRNKTKHHSYCRFHIY